MRLKSISLATAVIVATALTLGGCKKTPPTPAPVQSSTAAPSSASPEGQPATAAPAENAAAPAPGASTSGAPAPAPAEAVAPPAPPAPVEITAPKGARVEVSVTQELSAKNNNVGDRFTGVLSHPVTTSDGTVVFPRGAHVDGTVVAAKGRGKFKGSGALGIAVTSIAGMTVQTTSYEKEEKGKGKRTAGFIGGGAGGGALIGGLAGGGKGALIGGLVGAGAGTAGAAFTGNKDVVIPSESVILFHLTAPVTVTEQP